MRKDVLFLHIHEGLQASKKYGKLVEHKSNKHHYSGANMKKKYGKPDEYKSRKQH